MMSLFIVKTRSTTERSISLHFYLLDITLRTQTHTHTQSERGILKKKKTDMKPSPRMWVDKSATFLSVVDTCKRSDFLKTSCSLQRCDEASNKLELAG